MDLNQASGEKSSASEDIYIPFVATSWPSPETPVMIKSTPAKLKALLAGTASLKGIVRRAPLPYLVRHAWTQNHSLFAIIIEDRSSVRGFWLPAVVVYAVLLIWGVWSLFKSRRAASRQV